MDKSEFRLKEEILNNLGLSSKEQSQENITTALSKALEDILDQIEYSDEDIQTNTFSKLINYFRSCFELASNSLLQFGAVLSFLNRYILGSNRFSTFVSN